MFAGAFASAEGANEKVLGFWSISMEILGLSEVQSITLVGKIICGVFKTLRSNARTNTMFMRTHSTIRNSSELAGVERARGENLA